jgi:NAD(P)-dependent dehydrogenase (short-subunit alcohol dehydrogenase family)
MAALGAVRDGRQITRPKGDERTVMTERKIAVITGAGSGIGRGLARIADECGMTVVLADIDEAGMRQTASELGASALQMRTDVTDEDSVEALAARIFDEYGQVDLLFNNAGILRGGMSWEIALPEWRRMLDVNVMGVVNGMNRFLPRMIATGKPCRIVNTASAGGFVSSPFISPYIAAKFAVVALTEALAVELQLRKTKVAVSLLAPGSVKSNIYGDTGMASFGDDVQGSVREMEHFNDSIGVDPYTHARWVFGEIDMGNFWLIGQPEIFHPLIKDRCERIISGVNPKPQHYGKAMAEFDTTDGSQR